MRLFPLLRLFAEVADVAVRRGGGVAAAATAAEGSPLHWLRAERRRWWWMVERLHWLCFEYTRAAAKQETLRVEVTSLVEKLVSLHDGVTGTAGLPWQLGLQVRRLIGS